MIDKNKLNYEIECHGYDDTYILIYTTTDLQRKHVIEMFEEIKEKGKTKYKIMSKKIKSKIKSHIYKRGTKIKSYEPTDEDYRDMHDTFSLRENYPHGRTPEWVWNNWTEEQRLHFLRDHVNHLNDKTKKILLITNYENLRPSIKNEINNHVIEGRYEHGTKIESTNERNENYYENVVNELLNDNAIATIRMKTYGCEIQPYSPVDDAYMLPIKLTRSDLLALIIKSNVEFMNYDEKQILNELQSMTRLLMKK